MEFQTLALLPIGLLACLLWVLEFWKVGIKAQLQLPVMIVNENLLPKRFSIFLLGCVGLLLISFSLTGPRKPLKTIPSDIEVNDIFLVMDVSRSMLANDLTPNRLEVAKQKLREFAALRPTDRIGVIIFSEKIFTLLPLTTDPTLIDKIIADIKIGPLGSGTNIGDALGLAVARAQESRTKNKVIVLLTDGVSNVGNITPIQAAEMAKDFNIKVYTIGLGGKKTAQIPMGNGILSKRMQNIPGGSIDMETLEKISKMTGGKSYKADSENGLEEILSEIQKLEKTKIQNLNQVVYEELYWKYLALGILLYLVAELARRIWIKEVA